MRRRSVTSRSAFDSYWGVPKDIIENVAQAAAQFRANVIVGLGLDVLPFLAGVRNGVKVWYAADEMGTAPLDLV